MDWKTVSIQRLKDYTMRKESIKLLEDQIKTLEDQFTALRSVPTDVEPVMGGNRNGREDVMVSNIVMREELTANKEIALRELAITEKGLAALTDSERQILKRFYISRCHNHTDLLCRELNIEKSEVYRRKNEALDKFTIACYGVVRI